MLLSQLTSAAKIFLTQNHTSVAYWNDKCPVGYSFILVLVGMRFDFHILSNLQKIAANACPILHWPSSVIIAPRWTNSVTCSNSSPFNLTFSSICYFPMVIDLVFCT